MAPNVKFKGKGSNLVAYIKERFMLLERYVPTHNCCMLHDILSMQIAVNCTILRNAKLSRKLSGLPYTMSKSVSYDLSSQLRVCRFEGTRHKPRHLWLILVWMWITNGTNLKYCRIFLQLVPFTVPFFFDMQNNHAYVGIRLLPSCRMWSKPLPLRIEK